MLAKLSDRQEAILKSIVGAYIEQAVPVPSEAIAHAYHMRVSPATVRHEMAYLEGDVPSGRPGDG
ncbi:MAG: Heat-inducible transcription repressor HrcA [Dehalococcoidia bacterium]|nr:Heat-inducible transcription repressor HrcA [Dehalococcoidia bacterium]